VIGIFKQKSPANIFILLVFGILIKLPMFIHPHVPISKAEDGIFYQAIINFLAKTGTANPILFPLIAFSLLYLQAIFLNSFINNQRMLSKATFFPGMAYLLITSLFPEWNYFSAPLLVNTIVLFIL